MSSEQQQLGEFDDADADASDRDRDDLRADVAANAEDIAALRELLDRTTDQIGRLADAVDADDTDESTDGGVGGLLEEPDELPEFR